MIAQAENTLGRGSMTERLVYSSIGLDLTKQKNM